jgi:hypothetical protein
MPKFEQFSEESRKHPSEVAAFSSAIASYVGLEAGLPLIADRPSQPKLDSLEVYIVSRFGKILREENMDGKVTMFALGPLGQRAKEFLNRHPNPTEQEIAEAKADLGAALDSTGELVSSSASNVAASEDGEMNEKEKAFYMRHIWPKSSFVVLVISGCLSVLAGLCFRGGLLMRGLGVAVVNRAGSPASRWRIAGRAVLGWIWLLPAAGAFLQFTGLWDALGLALLLGAGVLMVGFNGRKSRGIPDRLAGTWLVPR